MQLTELTRRLAGTIVADQIVERVNDHFDGTNKCVGTDSITMPEVTKLRYTYHITNYTQMDEAFRLHIRVMEESPDGHSEVTNEALSEVLDHIRKETGEEMHVIAHNVGYGIMLEFPGL